MFEYKRQYSIVELTEDGLYHENETPPDYAGPKLKFTMTHFLLFVREDGELSSLSLNNPKAKDKSGNYTRYPVDKIYECVADVSEVWTEDGSGPAGSLGHVMRFPENVKKVVDENISELSSNPKIKITPHDVTTSPPEGTCD